MITLGLETELAAIVAAYVYVGHFSQRATLIHTGVLFGSTMAFNVWFRIWPAQQKIIRATKDGQAPDAALVALAGTRSKHNTYMSVPLVFTMISNHYPTIYGWEHSWLILAVAQCGPVGGWADGQP